jgi:hypothetical protein
MLVDFAVGGGTGSTLLGIVFMGSEDLVYIHQGVMELGTGFHSSRSKCLSPSKSRKFLQPLKPKAKGWQVARGKRQEGDFGPVIRKSREQRGERPRGWRGGLKYNGDGDEGGLRDLMTVSWLLSVCLIFDNG